MLIPTLVRPFPNIVLLFSTAQVPCVFFCWGNWWAVLWAILVVFFLLFLFLLFVFPTVSQSHSILEAFQWSVGKEFDHFLSHPWKEQGLDQGLKMKTSFSPAVGFILVRPYEAAGCERFVWPWPVWSLFCGFNEDLMMNGHRPWDIAHKCKLTFLRKVYEAVQRFFFLLQTLLCYESLDRKIANK